MHPNAKLNEAMVSEIRSRLFYGERICELAREFKVHRQTIRQIKARDKWKHVA
jgi:DNA invertase Pin-like site-specific DNA recombinase